MNKRNIQQLLLLALEKQLSNAQAGLEQAYDSATHKENIAENKYDTLGLEASYLAHGQAVRVTEIQQQITRFKRVAKRDLIASDQIEVDSLVELKGPSAISVWYYISLYGAGQKLELNQVLVTVISPNSPLGQVLLGLEPNDEVKWQTPLTVHSVY